MSDICPCCDRKLPQSKNKFDGAVYDPARDDNRLTKQIGRVYDLMIDGNWRTIGEISTITGDPENSVQAQLRHLRKPKYGSYQVNKRIRTSPALYEYQLCQNTQNKRLKIV